MARDSQAALVALNRFGFGARGGASGDFVNAASDPRGFVKAELGAPTACCWKCRACNRRRRSAQAVFAYQVRSSRRAKPPRKPPSRSRSRSRPTAEAPAKRRILAQRGRD